MQQANIASRVVEGQYPDAEAKGFWKIYREISLGFGVN